MSEENLNNRIKMEDKCHYNDCKKKSYDNLNTPCQYNHNVDICKYEKPLENLRCHNKNCDKDHYKNRVKWFNGRNKFGSLKYKGKNNKGILKSNLFDVRSCIDLNEIKALILNRTNKDFNYKKKIIILNRIAKILFSDNLFGNDKISIDSIFNIEEKKENNEIKFKIEISYKNNCYIENNIKDSIFDIEKYKLDEYIHPI